MPLACRPKLAKDGIIPFFSRTPHMDEELETRGACKRVKNGYGREDLNGTLEIVKLKAKNPGVIKVSGEVWK